MTSLIVTLADTLPTAATLCEGVLTSDGFSVTQHVEVPMALLPAPAGTEIVALVPASRLSWHRIELPRGTLARGFLQEGSAPRLRAVLDGLLEDRLLDDPAQLHFAIEPQPKAGAPVWVAVCERAWLHAWLAALEQAGRPVARIVPEVAPRAGDAADISLTVTGTPDHAQLVLSGSQGVTVLPLSSASVALLAWPAESEVMAEPGVAALAEQHFNGRVSLQTRPQRAVAAAQSAWELAQFDLLDSRRARTRKRLSALTTTLLHAPRWRAARWGVVALVAINLLGLQAWAWKEQSQLTAKRSAIRGALASTFPEVRVVVDPPLQMARALADLQRQSGTASNTDMETMLGQFQAAAPAVKAPSAIEFGAGVLRLKGLDAANAGLDAVAASLRGRGYSMLVEGDSVVLKPEQRP
jgi:general secretion pathway protein L